MLPLSLASRRELKLVTKRGICCNFTSKWTESSGKLLGSQPRCSRQALGRKLSSCSSDAASHYNVFGIECVHRVDVFT